MQSRYFPGNKIIFQRPERAKGQAIPGVDINEKTKVAIGSVSKGLEDKGLYNSRTSISD
ncbi:Uncharacterised protein [Serratia liquefaciens]|nr:Uncharacterised protein [Serratia liquefaciens]